MEEKNNMIENKNKSMIIDYLKSQDLIANQNIIGIIKNDPEARIYTDQAESISGVLVRSGTYFNYLYAQTSDFLDAVKSSFFTEANYGFSGVLTDTASQIMTNKTVEWSNPCHLYYVPSDCKILPPSDIYIRTLTIDDAEKINNHYNFKSDQSLSKIQKDLLDRPSSGYMVNDELVAWVLVHEDNSLGIMYVMEEHRGKGYAEALTYDLINKVRAQGILPYIQILIDNKASVNLAKKCGFIPYLKDTVVWFGI